MTTNQFHDKLEALLFGNDNAGNDNAGNDIKKECERLFKSNALDLAAYGDNYELPKIILYVALKNVADRGYMPLTTSGKKTAKNLEKF